MENNPDQLLCHLDKIHTTPMGVQRIKRNLALGEDTDAVAWCIQQIQAAVHIERRGKNWYAHTGTAVITVNASSYTIITAHKKGV